MPQHQIDEDVLELVIQAVQPHAFESFSSALGRYFKAQQAALRQPPTQALPRSVENLLAELDALPDQVIKTNLPNYERKKRLKAPSPEPSGWRSQVSELRSRTDLGSWKAICEHLGIDIRGDSARRRLREWVKTHRPTWPSVPDV